MQMDKNNCFSKNKTLKIFFLKQLKSLNPGKIIRWKINNISKINSKYSKYTF